MILPVAVARFNSVPRCDGMQGGQKVASTRSDVASFETVNSLYLNTKGMFLARTRSRDNDVDQALRVLKKKMQREGVFREMKRRKFYEKPSEKSNREKAEAIRRARKFARKKAQREGVIAAPRGRKVPPGRATGRGPFSVARGVRPQP
jgi:small subunit ribosomal protein S21